MSTHSVVARVGEHEGEFAGRYIHSDGYPTWRGVELFRIAREEFNGDWSAMLRFIIDEHPAGWSILQPENRSCYCHPRRSKREGWNKRQAEPARLFTHEDMKDSDVAWLYVFDEENRKLYVREVRHDAEMIVDLDQPEPDWSVIECGENLERCSHYAWVHNLTPKTSNLSTQTWLGKSALEFHDAIAFIIGGKRYASTGNGGHSDYLRQYQAKSYPPNTWVATIKAKNGKRLDIPVAKIIDGREYRPLPNVLFVYPPTKDTHHETIVGSNGVVKP